MNWQELAAARRAHPDAMLCFRLGNFYEFVGEDAPLVGGIFGKRVHTRRFGPEGAVTVEVIAFPYYEIYNAVAALRGGGRVVVVYEGGEVAGW